MKEEFLKEPTKPFEIDPNDSIYDILKKMEKISFQGRTLAQALSIWEKMLLDDVIIFFGLAGAMVPAGMRKIIVYLIKERFIDCLVSTGANLFHDIHEIRGKYHYLGNPNVNDILLRKCKIDRIYDTFASEEEFIDTDNFIISLCEKFEQKRFYSTREFLYLLGKELDEFKEEGILNTAYRYNIPIYCPAIGDSSIGIALTEGKRKGKVDIKFDVIKDVYETAYLTSLKKSGVIYIGGGIPKNFIQQTEVTAPFLGFKTSGHSYAIQFTMDAPHWGGLSGCTFSEAQSWGKISLDAKMITCYCDATIALPIVVTALAQKKIKRNKVIQFKDLDKEEFKII
ncbi:MAG: deoxyhypusine synthase [candidate division WOR-3 bacterium]|nr:deoxyhypusine synthase [candidate division WOR-3 bacterium]MCX7836508.1 deoxyhypusine synthase [candidate division WOR-3 bacterium]MDW8114447.1 deoxyhypusine synthase [candidate division WOR-3 bacterium]